MYNLQNALTVTVVSYLFQVWKGIKEELVSNIQIHVYRQSDIPNRQGHCNSNPYIPNQLRVILGMPLIQEKVQARRRNRKK
jgi:hypothetical protein